MAAALILTELFRADGYDAIIYRGQLGEGGYNVVIFDLADAEVQDGRPYEVTKVDLAVREAGNPWVRQTMTMLNPCHPGEILRDNLEAAELSVTDAAARLGCSRQALSRLLNGKAGISPAMAIALEGIGWSDAAYWMRLQAAYDLAQERRRQAA